jgi:CHAT domain-containing protein/tetratricopeptide (TPR) repeat protein
MHHCEARRAAAWRLLCGGRLIAALVIAILFPSAVPAANDPVTAFIVSADSLARLPDENVLREYVSDHAVLTGAAIGQLLDAAIPAGDAGDKQGEDENIALAERLGRLYESITGSRAPLDLVKRYQSWTPDDRAARRKAKTAEKRSADAKAAGDLDGAVALLEEARGIYQTIGDRRSEAVVWGSLGVAHWGRGDMDAVLASYEKALEERRAIEDRILEGRTLNGLGSGNYQKGRYEIAADYYRQAVDLRRRTGDLGGLGTSLTYLGNAYLQIGRLVDARDAYEQALDILGETGEARQRFEVTNSIGNLYFAMGRIRDASDTYRRALDIALAAADTLGEITTRNNLASSLAREYRYRDALEELEIVRQRLETNPDPLQTLLYYKNSGMAQLALGEIDRARDDLLSFVRASQEQEAPIYQIEALKNLGYLYEEVGANERALDYAKKAMALADSVGHEGMQRDAEMLAAQLETSLARYGEALGFWNAALEKDVAAGADVRIIEDEMGIANVLALQGHAEEARKKYRDIEPRVRESGSGDALVALHLGMGHTWEKSNPDSARYYYEQALSILEETRSSLGSAGVRVGYLGGTRRWYYEEVARYYASLAGAEGNGSRAARHGKNDSAKWSALAFETVERAKARGLLDLLEGSVLAQGSLSENAVLDSLYALDPKAPGFKEEQRKLEDRYSELRAGRLRDSTGLGAKTEIVALEEIKRSIPKDAALLSYALGDTLSLLWVIDRKDHDLIELPNRSVLEPEVARLSDALTRPGAGDAALEDAARKLYEILVAPASGRLKNKKKLVIVPDGFLFEIPYEVLLTGEIPRESAETDKSSEPTGIVWSDLPYLARSFTTVYAPSASVYASLEDAKSKSDYKLDLLALGDPDYSTLAAGNPVSGPLEQLPFTREEVEAIGTSVRPGRKDVLIGSAASEAALKDGLKAGSARIVHLAVHGLVDPAEPTRSCIALSPDASSKEDGYFHTLEILSAPVTARLVVLSACESGTGRLSRGEGVVGLSRSFIGAGAGGVVASLWKVSDESTSVLMKEFYNRMIGEKEPAAVALSGARKAMIANEKYAHPFHWAAFVVIGSDRAPW